MGIMDLLVGSYSLRYRNSKTYLVDVNEPERIIWSIIHGPLQNLHAMGRRK